jgi:arylsulfatase A-like enzyme
VSLVVVSLIAARVVAAQEPPKPAAAPDPRPNLLLVTLDTTRADEIAPWGKGGVAPHFDALADESVVAMNAHAPAPLTFPSHTSMMTGLWPYAHGVRDNDLYRLDPSAQTLAELLKGTGYRTEAIVAASVLRASTGLDQGFELYQDLKFKRGRNVAANIERKADEVTKLLLERLAVADARPWFLWAHYFDAHAPYVAPNGPGLQAPMRAQHEAEVHYVDEQFARVLDQLRSSGALAKTWVVVVADHGEGLGVQQEMSHSYLAEEGTLKVPFLVRRPDGALRGRLLAPASTADVFPTLLAAAGLAPPYAIEGKDVVAMFATEQAGGAAADELAQRALWFETWAGWHVYHWAPLEGVIVNGMKYVRNVQPELFDVSDPDAPDLEKKNLASERPQVLAALERRYASLPQDGVAHLSSARPTLPPDEQARLLEIGYLARMVGDDSPSLEGTLDPRVHYKSCVDEEVAIEAARARKFEVAVPLLERLVRDYPKNTGFRETLGKALLEAGRRDDAAAVLTAALAIDPGLVVSNYLLGSIQRDAARRAAQAHADPKRVAELFADARRFLEKTVAISPVHLEGWLQLRDVHDLQRDYAAVLRDSVEIVKLAADLHDEDGEAIAANTADEWLPKLFEKRLANDPKRKELAATALSALPKAGSGSPAVERARKVLEEQAAR